MFSWNKIKILDYNKHIYILVYNYEGVTLITFKTISYFTLSLFQK